MKLVLNTPIRTELLTGMLASVGQDNMLNGTVYTPLMQVLVVPTNDQHQALAVWELMQKLYANKDGEVELGEGETKLLKEKLNGVVFPWLKARLLSLFPTA